MDNSNKFRSEIEQGENLFQNGLFDEALKVFESCLVRDPNNVAALNNKGVTLNSLGRYKEAIQTFSEVLKKDNSNSNSAFNLIANYIAIGDWTNARNAFLKFKRCLSQSDAEMIQKDFEKNISVKKKEAAPIVCSICRHPELKKIATNNSFGINIVECSRCGFAQSEYVSESALRDYYSRFYRPFLSEEQIRILRQKSYDQAVSQIEYIDSIIPGKRFTNALDFGTADGELAKLLKGISQAVYVTEFDPQYVELLKKEKELILLDESDLDSAEFSKFFDFIAISHVLEHVTDPISFLESFSKLLKKDGFLLVDIPNELELLTKANFQAKGHLSYFTVDSFRQLVDTHGKFDIFEIRTCNRSVEEFISSGFSLSEQYFRQNTPNGTVIRTLLTNVRPDDPFDRQPNDFIDNRLLLDEYSRRLLHLHQYLMTLEKEKQNQRES